MVNDPNGPRRTLAAFAIALEIAAVLTTPLSAQSSSGGPSEDQLAKASQNPVANLVSFPLQYNYYTAGGLGPNSQMVLNVQPVLPLPMGKRWLLVSRTISPIRQHSVLERHLSCHHRFSHGRHSRHTGAGVHHAGQAW